MSAVVTVKPRVLIVDDQPRNLDVLEVMLGDTDCVLVRAVSPEEALLAVVRHDFAALVIDIQMPGMSGIELAMLIKQRKRSRDVPILFLTAHTVTDDDLLRGYEVGAVDYLSKPLNAEILRSKVGVFVDAFRKTRELADVNATLQREVAERERTQAALEAANAELERRVQERTAALTRALQGVRENEERLRMSLDVARVAAWEWHLATGEVRWSTDPEALFGFPAGAFGADRRIFRTAHADDRAAISDAITTALESGTYEAEFRAVRPDGECAWITERGQRFADTEGDRIVGISRDVTVERLAAQERERLLKRERDARDEAEHQSRLKDEFLATLSHELRTPMNAVLGWLSILESGKPVRELNSALAVITRNAQMQAKLIEDLLDMNRLISGNVHLEISNIAVTQLIQTTVLGLQPAADAKGVDVKTLVASNAGELRGDGRRLQQVLWNLVHNAIKFTPARGRVEVRAERRGHELYIEVHDDGQGISPTFLPYVFERFRQQDASSTRASHGLGLGLSIAKQLVELHGGTINAQSDGDGGGAIFTVRVPVALAGVADGRHGSSTSSSLLDAPTR